MMHLKMGKKIHLKEYETDSLAEDLNAFFDRMVNVGCFNFQFAVTKETQDLMDFFGETQANRLMLIHFAFVGLPNDVESKLHQT